VTSSATSETREQHLASLFAAMTEVDKWTRQVIIDDLTDLIGPLDEAEQEAAGRLQNAVAALEGPQENLASLDREMRTAQNRCNKFRDEVESGSVDRRARARWHLSEWQGELEKIRQKRQQVREDMIPLIAERDQAREDLKAIGESKAGLALNMADCYAGAVSMGTWSYETFRVQAGHLSPMLWAHDDTNPEWSRGVEWVLELCERAGVRTDGSTGMRRLASNAEQLANTLAELDKSGQPEVYPSGREALAQNAVIAENAKLARERQLIEDYRQPRPPKVTAEREWMQVQRLRELR
jgi:hypothetical protein